MHILKLSIAGGLLLYVVLSLSATCIDAAVKSRYPQAKTKAERKPKPPKLNTDALPALPEILEGLGLSQFLPNFIKMGVVETRLLVRLSSMDFQMMLIEWEGITKEDVAKLKAEVASLVVRATVPEETSRPEVKERDKLTYGRVYIPDTVQSFEYVSASFGGPPPVGKHRMEIPANLHGCDDVGKGSEDKLAHNYEGSIAVTLRGGCTFLQKAAAAYKYNASGLVVVNTEDRLESPASGYGIDKNITEASVLAIGKFPIITLSNTTWLKIQYAYMMNQQVSAETYLDIVPLKCKSGGTCQPLLEEERRLQDEVSWGKVRVRQYEKGTKDIKEDKGEGASSLGALQEVRSFDFLTSNFGSQLPTRHSIKVVFADPIDACSPLVVDASPAPESTTTAGSGDLESTAAEMNVDGVVASTNSADPSNSNTAINASDAATNRTGNTTTRPASPPPAVFRPGPAEEDVVVVAHRGQCPFHVKMLHAQAVPGARLLAVVDVQDSALQRLGGVQPTAGYVAMPSIIITASAGEYLHAVANTTTTITSTTSSSSTKTMTMEVLPARDSVGADRWIDLAFTQWSADPAEQIMQIEVLMQKYSSTARTSIATTSSTSQSPEKEEDISGGDGGEILAWLQRRLLRLTDGHKKAIDTDA